MPKIPTFTAGRTEMTTQASGVTTNIQINPNATIASAISSSTDALTLSLIHISEPTRPY